MTMEIFNEEEKMPSTRQDSNPDGGGVSEIFRIHTHRTFKKVQSKKKPREVK